MEQMTPEQAIQEIQTYMYSDCYLDAPSNDACKLAISALEKQVPKKAVYVKEVYEHHDWITDKHGKIDDFAMSVGKHNGPVCKRCFDSFCIWCVNDFEKELKKPCDCSHYACPSCRKRISLNKKFCDCGQAIDWSE